MSYTQVSFYGLKVTDIHAVMESVEQRWICSAAGNWSIVLTSLKLVCQSGGLFGFVPFSFRSLEEFVHIFLMILNGGAVAVCAVGVQAVGDGTAELHSTSLGPRLPSWSHIKEQPSLSTCAGWSPFRFPHCRSTHSYSRYIHTYT